MRIITALNKIMIIGCISITVGPEGTFELRTQFGEARQEFAGSALLAVLVITYSHAQKAYSENKKFVSSIQNSTRPKKHVFLLGVIMTSKLTYHCSISLILSWEKYFKAVARICHLKFCCTI